MSAGRILKAAEASQRKVREDNAALREKALARAVEDVLTGDMNVGDAARNRGVNPVTLAREVRLERERRAAKAGAKR